MYNNFTYIYILINLFINNLIQIIMPIPQPLKPPIKPLPETEDKGDKSTQGETKP